MFASVLLSEKKYGSNTFCDLTYYFYVNIKTNVQQKKKRRNTCHMKVYHRWDWMLELFPNFRPALAFFTCFRGCIILQWHPQDVRGACFLKAWHHHPWRRPVMAESPGRAPISSLCFGRPSCYLTWLRPNTTSMHEKYLCFGYTNIYYMCILLQRVFLGFCTLASGFIP